VEHFRSFNAAVRSHDWSAFLARFTPDAVMRFDGIPVGPYVGLEQIDRDILEKQP
jgi:steroid Delta-isomerase